MSSYDIRKWESVLETQVKDELAQVFKKLKIYPLVKIESLQGKWGDYNGFSRTIRIDPDLLINAPWNSLLLVLKHELAHFLVDIMHPHQNEKPHGELFKQYCQKLGVPSSARLSAESLKIQVEYQKNVFRDKFEKLMALTGSNNPHESQAALLKAQALLDRHKLSVDNFKESVCYEHFTYHMVGVPKRRIDSFTKELVHFIERFYLVKAVCVQVFDFKRNQSSWQYEIMGKALDVDIAMYVFDYIINQVSVYQPKGTADKRSFKMGFLKGLYEKFESNQNLYTHTQKQLVETENTE